MADCKMKRKTVNRILSFSAVFEDLWLKWMNLCSFLKKAVTDISSNKFLFKRKGKGE